MNLIQLDSVTVRRLSKTVLHELSITITAGEKICLCGANGAGKTTLLELLAGVRSPTLGIVEKQCRAAFVPQEHALYGALTVRENLDLFGAFDHDVLRDFQLLSNLDTQVFHLSHGTKARVGICRALGSDAQLLLLDEVDAALDSGTSEVLKQYLSHETRAWVAITHRDLLTVLPGVQVRTLSDGRLV